MSTHPYIPLYVDDYDSHTAHLTPEEDGIYGRLLRLTWRTPGCTLPVDDAWIARKIRLSADEFARIARPVLDEFFKVKRGRYVQGRLKDEYDDISRRKTARQNAGKKGGIAKARKTLGNEPSNATVLPSDTCAFPYPYPPPEEEANASPVGSQIATDGPFGHEAEEPKPAKPSPWSSNAAFQAFWLIAGPQMRTRSSQAKVWPEWKRVSARVSPEALAAALRRYVAEDGDYQRTGGPGLHSWLKDGRWEHWLAPTGGNGQAPTRRFPDDEIRAAVMAHDPDCCAKWLDKCEWVDAERVIVPPNAYVGEQLAKGAGRTLRALNITSIRNPKVAA